MKSRSFGISKSPLMLMTTLLIWVALLWRYESFFFPLFSAVDSSLSRSLVAFAVCWINLVWFYGVFHFMSVLFSMFAKEIPNAVGTPIGKSDDVAILYTTCNDFCVEAAESCLNQDYPHFTLYILDDSTSSSHQSRIDLFCRQNADRCSLVRRTNRGGFKAGNLNNALQTVAAHHKYFSVVDADELLPKDFLSRIIPRFRIDNRIGFVQANHQYRREKISKFTSCLSTDVDLHWGLFLSARNKFGFVMFYGHGAVIRTDVWKKVGGFPAIVSEDIAFATKARELGFYGVFMKDLVAEEAFPEDYACFLRREIKVVRGSLEFLFGPARSFLRSRNVTFTERFDLLASVTILFLPVVFLCFLIVANVILPMLISSSMTSFRTTPYVGEWTRYVEAFGAGIRDLWSFDFYILTLVSILSPLFYQFRKLVHSPLRMLRYASHSTAVFLSIIPSLAWEIVSYAVGRRTEFKPTGERASSKSHRKPGREMFSLVLGSLLLLFSLLMWNLALLTVASSFILHSILLRFNWNSATLRFVSVLPFVFFVFVFGSIPLLLIGMSGMLVVIMPAHH